jgi:hypothetical protein
MGEMGEVELPPVPPTPCRRMHIWKGPPSLTFLLPIQLCADLSLSSRAHVS